MPEKFYGGASSPEKPDELKSMGSQRVTNTSLSYPALAHPSLLLCFRDHFFLLSLPTAEYYLLFLRCSSVSSYEYFKLSENWPFKESIVWKRRQALSQTDLASNSLCDDEE